MMVFFVLLLEVEDIHHRAGQQAGVARVLDANLAQHLTDDDLDVLVADADALEAVNHQNFLEQVFLNGLHAENAQQIVRVDLSLRSARRPPSTRSPSFTFRRLP